MTLEIVSLYVFYEIKTLSHLPDLFQRENKLWEWLFRDHSDYRVLIHKTSMWKYPTTRLKYTFQEAALKLNILEEDLKF